LNLIGGGGYEEASTVDVMIWGLQVMQVNEWSQIKNNIIDFARMRSP
jgi:hypothetical protein